MLKSLNCSVVFHFDQDARVNSVVSISAVVAAAQAGEYALRFFAYDAAQVSCTLNDLALPAQLRDAGTARTLTYTIQTLEGENTIVVRYPQLPRLLSEGKSDADSVWVVIVPLRQFRAFGVEQNIQCELRASVPPLSAAGRLLLKKRSIALGGKSDNEERGIVYNAKLSGGSNLITAACSPGFSFPDQLSVKAGNF